MFSRTLFTLTLLTRLVFTGKLPDSRSECLRKLHANLVFIVDASDTTDSFVFEFYVKDYMNNVVRKFHIGKQNVLVSVLLYSERLFLAINAARVQTLADLLSAIRKLPHLGGSSSSANLGGAITGTVSAVFPTRNNRTLNEAIRVVILLSTGRLSTTHRTPEIHVEKTSTLHNRLFDAVDAAHQPIRGPAVSQQETSTSGNHTRLEQLGYLLNNRTDYVFSIGLKGASKSGVRLLANGNEARTFLIDNDQYYREFSVDMFDPSLIICPNPVKMACACPIKSSATSKTSVNSFNSINLEKIRPESVSSQHANKKHADDFAQLVHVQMSKFPTGGDEIDTRNQRNTAHLEPIRSLYAIHMQPGVFLNKPKNPSNILREPVWRGHSALGALSPWFSKVGQYVLRPIPVYSSAGVIQRPRWIVERSLHTSGPKLMLPTILPRPNDETVSDKGNTSDKMKILSQPERKVQNPSSNVTRVKPGPHNEINQSTGLPTDSSPFTVRSIGEEAAFSTLTPSTIPPMDKNKLNNDKNQSQSANIKLDCYPNHHSWKDSATHKGGILMLTIRARSGLRYRHIYDQTAQHNTDRSNLFVNPQFYQWTPGTFDRVLLELWTAGQPQVQLVFDGQYTGNYGWFQKSLLREVYPWPKSELENSTLLLSSLTTPFSITRRSSKDTDASKSSSLFCSELKTYLLIADLDSPLTACYRAADNRYPMLLYGMPFTSRCIENEQNQTDQKFGFQSDCQWTMNRADELRIYAIPYSLWDQGQPNDPKLASYPLLLALDSRLRVSFRHLWYQRLVSPPGYQPIRFGDVTNSSRCECWFRSPVLEHWIRPGYPPGTSYAFVGFPRMRIEFRNDQGQIVGILMFDGRGARADHWFTPTRLTFSWPWRIDELRRCAFVQFGVPQNSPSLTYNVTEKNIWSQVDLWIGKITQLRGNRSSIPVCTSLVLFISSPMGHYGRLPPCLFGLDGVRQMNGEVFMGVSQVEAMAWQMIRVHQMTIWST